MMARGLGGAFSRVQTGAIRNYILVFAVGVIVTLGYFALDWRW